MTGSGEKPFSKALGFGRSMKVRGPKRRGGFNPRLWAHWMPNGLGQVKPNHYGAMITTAWRNKRHPLYAWRILRDGVCDGCALGTSGLRDHTMDGVHLCTVRLNLLGLNTASAFDPKRLEDVSVLKDLDGAQLRALGRIPFPMVRHRGQRGFSRITWEAALNLVAQRLQATDPERAALYVTSRGLTNETYYAAQKAWRALGSNNVDNSSRICHAPSTVALKRSLGVAATTCSYSDWIGSDLIVFFGADVPNNQPVTTKYLHYAKAAGTRIAVVNPYKEPGLERYWVPSVTESALFGTKIMDSFYPVHTGGDMAFIHGVLKALDARSAFDEAFIAAHTTGFEELMVRVRASSWDELERLSGSTQADMERFADEYAKAKSAVFVWSMGITQHTFGVQNVEAIVNLALSRGMVGRPHTGLMPIRGHSGVQGGAEMGCVPNALPGGDPVDDEVARRRVEEAMGVPVPLSPGLDAVAAVDAAHEGLIDVLWSIGGNYLDTLPEPDYVRAALSRVPLRIHQDIVLTHQMFVENEGSVLLLPATTRYELEGGGTETSTERRVYFSPEIPGPRIGEARAEWSVLSEVVARARPEHAARVRVAGTPELRKEIAKAAPMYAGIEKLGGKGDSFQWGGPHLCAGNVFPTADGKARFAALSPPDPEVPPGQYRLSTRRGKQFNSMVQGRRDPLNGAAREDVLMAAADAQALGLSDGDAVRVVGPAGQFMGRVRSAPMRPGNLQMHWPEANVLLPRGRRDPACGIPDYNAFVRLEVPARGGAA
jgi:molybdopterin-dependent oxidoreductase alpha subunit